MKIEETEIVLHSRKDLSMCIYSFSEGIVKGSFFEKKPRFGDTFMTFTRSKGDSLLIFEITRVMINRDVKVQGKCSFDPTLAYFEFEVEDVTEDPKYKEINNSVRNNY